MTLDDEISKLLENLLNDSNGPAGVAFGAIDKNGKILVNVAKGTKDIDTKEPLEGAVYALWSATKLIGSMAVLKAIDDGLLELDSPVSKILPKLDTFKIIKNDGTFEEPKTPITIRQLLTHTSGFAYEMMSPLLQQYAKERGRGLEKGRLQDISNPLLFSPGGQEQWKYGPSIDWACFALEAVTGKSLGLYCKENLFEPLDACATFQIPNGEKLAMLHDRDENGKLVKQDFPPMTKSPERDFGGSSGFATLEGFLKLLVPLINNGQGANGAQILKPDTVKKLIFTNQAKCEPLKQISQEEVEFGFGYLKKSFTSLGHGLVGALNTKPLANGRSANSTFWSGSGNLYWSADPNSGLATFFATEFFPYGNQTIVDASLAAEGLVLEYLGKK